MSDANFVLDTSLRALAADLGSKAASNRVQNQFTNSVKVPFILPTGYSQLLIRRYGFPVIGTDKKPLTTDHKLMAVDREVIRDVFERMTKASVTRIPTLYFGCGYMEVSRYYSNTNSEFYFHLSEGKDTGRALLPILDDFLDRFHNYLSATRGGATCRDRKASQLRLQIEKVEDLFSAYETVRPESLNGTRLHIVPPQKSFPRGIWLDSAYNNAEEDYFTAFEDHGLHEAFVAGVFPAEILFPECVPDKEYVVTRTNCKWDGAVDLGLLVVKDLLKFFLKAKLGPLVFLLRLAYSVHSQGLYKSGEKVALAKLMAIVNEIGFAKFGYKYGIAKFIAVAYAAVRKVYCSRISLTYKNGESNGYDHPEETWSLLMRKPVLSSPSHDFIIEVECVQRAGDHCLFRLARSTSVRPVVRTISTPPLKEAVLILDIPATFSSGLKTLLPKYRSVSKADFEHTINFLCGQKVETLKVEAVQTLVNRASMGVRIATTEVVPKWDMEESELWAFSLACGIEAQRRLGDIAAIMDKHSDLLLKSKQTNAAWLLKQVATGAAMVSTLGGAFPLAYLCDWLSTKYPTLPIVKPANCKTTQRWEPTDGVTMSGGDAPLYDRCLLMPNLAKDAEVSCPILKLMQPFGKQKPVCLHKPGEHERTIKVGMTDTQVAELKAKLRTARETAPPDLASTLDRCKDALPQNGFEMELRVNLIVGGPGSGKSHTIRNIVRNIDKASNDRTFVFAPFGKLAPDYPQTAKNEYPAFNFRTTHNLIHERGVKHVFNDEYTCMDEEILIATLFMCNADTLWFVGDEKQTGVLTHEGTRIFSEGSRFRLHDCTAHLLAMQFRSDVFPVAWCNYFRDSGMYAVNEVIKVPTVHPTEEYNALPSNFVTMCFSHETAHECGQEAGHENSVRSNQGGTLDNVAIVVKMRDLALLQNDALFMVAITRHRVGGSLRFYVDEGPAKTAVTEKLGFNDEKFMANLLQHARPDLDKLYGTTSIEDQKEFNAIVEKLYKMDVLDSTEWEQSINYTEVACKTLDELRQEVFDRYTANGTPRLTCSSCGSTDSDSWDGSTYCDVCEGDKFEEVEIMVQEELGDLDFSAPGWCLVHASTNPIVESNSAYKKRKGKDGKRVHKGVDAKIFCGYKEHVKASGYHVTDKGVPVDVFITFLDSIHQPYLIEVLADHDGTVEEFFCSGDLGEDFIAITITLGHATSMAWERLQLYVKEEKYTFNEPGAKPFDLVLPGWTTFAQVADRYPKWQLKLRISGTLPLATCYNARTTYGFARKQLVGYKPTWGETYVRLHDTVVSEPAGPRTFSLQPEIVPSLGFMAVDTEGAGYERLLSKETLQGTDVYSFNAYHDAGTCARDRENETTAPYLANVPMKLDNLDTTRLIGPTAGTGQFAFDGAPRPEFCISAGFGIHQANNDVEKLGSATRYLQVRKQYRYSVEGERLATKLAATSLSRYYDLDNPVYDPYLDAAVASGWHTDAKVRGYADRVEADYENGRPEAYVTYMNKAQDKVQKKVQEVKRDKVGQGISAVGPSINYLYGAMWRILNARKAQMSKPTKIYDCGMSESSLKTTLFEQLKQNVFDTVVTFDVVQCDARQNWFNAHAEKVKNLALADAAWHPYIDRYYEDVRGIYKMSAPGLFSATVQGPKPSGAPDTLKGNGDAVEDYVTGICKVYGPEVDIEKGDDRAKWATKIEIDKRMVKELSHFTAFETDICYGSAQFTGKVVTPEGMFDDVIKKARKAVMHRAANYKAFAEYQESLRDTIKQIAEVGTVETIANTAYEYEVSYEEAAWHYQMLYSLSHINADQWASVVQDRQFAKPTFENCKQRAAIGGVRLRVSSYANYVDNLPVKTQNKTLTRREQRKRAKERLKLVHGDSSRA